jgi:hypothetical protein
MTTPHVDDAFLLHLVAISAPTNLPLYPVMVRDQTFTVIIDNGASDNYVSQRVVPFADAITTVQGRTVETAEGERIAIQDEVRLTLHFDNFHDTINAQVFDSKFDIILGRTWLRRIQPVANWQNGKLGSHKSQPKSIIIGPIDSSLGSSALTDLVFAKQTEKWLKLNKAECFLDHITPDTIIRNVSSDWQTFLNCFQSRMSHIVLSSSRHVTTTEI